MTAMKKITAILLALSFLFVLCACGDKEFYSTDATIGENKEDDMQAILSGTFYFDCVMTSYGETGHTVFAVDGDNIFMRAEMDGVELGMIYMGEIMYMLYGEQYAELEDRVLKMMGIDVEGDIPAQLGFNQEDILAMFTGLDTQTAKKEKTKLGDIDVTSYTYTRESGSKTVVYLDDNGDMLRAESYSSREALIESMDFTEVSGVVPTELFILDNYKKTNILRMMFEVSKVMGIEGLSEETTAAH